MFSPDAYWVNESLAIEKYLLSPHVTDIRSAFVMEHMEEQVTLWATEWTESDFHQLSLKWFLWASAFPRVNHAGLPSPPTFPSYFPSPFSSLFPSPSFSLSSYAVYFSQVSLNLVTLSSVCQIWFAQVSVPLDAEPITKWCQSCRWFVIININKGDCLEVSEHWRELGDMCHPLSSNSSHE